MGQTQPRQQSQVNYSDCIIVTDVDGILSADPRIITDGYTINELSHSEARELAFCGANVLSRHAIDALNSQTMYIMNARGGACTKIVQQKSIYSRGPVALAVLHHRKIIQIQAQNGAGFLARVATIFATQNVNLEAIFQSATETEISVVIHANQVEKAFQALSKEWSPTVSEEVAVLTLVGDGMQHCIGVSSQVYRSLEIAGINIRASSQGANERSISIVVSADDMQSAATMMHAVIVNHKKRSASTLI